MFNSILTMGTEERDDILGKISRVIWTIPDNSFHYLFREQKCCDTKFNLFNSLLNRKLLFVTSVKNCRISRVDELSEPHSIWNKLDRVWWTQNIVSAYYDKAIYRHLDAAKQTQNELEELSLHWRKAKK